MAIEQPPIKDQGLAAYLVRAFTALQSSIDSVKTFFVLGEVKNPQAGKLYFVKNATAQLPTEGLYFFNGNSFVKLTDASSAVKLGVSHDDAYYGDFGKAAYDHSNKTGNPHGLSLLDIGLENVDNTSDKDKPISDATQAAINGFVPTSRRINGQTLVADVTLGTGNINETFNRYYVSYSQRLLVTYNANASADGYLLGSDWVIFNGKQDALGFTPENVVNKVIAWSSPTDTQYTSAKLVNDTFALYLPLSSYHLYYRGKFTTLAALNAAIPAASAGDYAQVDVGVGHNVVNYNWDDEEGWVIGSAGSGATNTDGLPEGTTNLYFTVSRVLATLLTGFSSTAGAVGSTDTILTAFNKVVGNFNTPASYPTLNQNTTGSAAKLTTARTIDSVSFDGSANITVIAAGTHAATSKATPVDADELPLVDSAASNVLNKLTWANLKATLKAYFDTLYAVAPTTWTPTITGLTAGTGGTITARWKPLPGKLAFFSLDIVFGTVSTNSTTWKFTLPAATISGRPTYAAIASNAYMYTNGFVYLIMPLLTSTTEVTINLTDATTASIFGKALTVNMFASGNSISISGTYEVA